MNNDSKLAIAAICTFVAIFSIIFGSAYTVHTQHMACIEARGTMVRGFCTFCGAGQ